MITQLPEELEKSSDTKVSGRYGDETSPSTNGSQSEVSCCAEPGLPGLAGLRSVCDENRVARKTSLAFAPGPTSYGDETSPTEIGANSSALLILHLVAKPGEEIVKQNVATKHRLEGSSLITSVSSACV